MKRSLSKFSLAALAIITAITISLLAQPAQGTTITFTLDTEFSGATPSSGNLTATLNDDDAACGGIADCVVLTMDATGLSGAEKVDEWLFNLDPSLDPTDLSFEYQAASTGPSAAVATGANAFKADGDGDFDILFDFPPPPGSDVFGDNEVVIYRITGISGLTVDDFNFPSVNGPVGKTGFCSAAHVQGIGATGSDSGWMGADCEGDGGGGGQTPVPEPSTLVLLGSGLLLLNRITRRFRSKND